MERQGNKYRKGKKINNKIKLVTIGLLIITSCFMFIQFRNDISVSVDIDAQKMLDRANAKDKNLTFHIDEKRFVEILHRMTHQKVKSKHKHSSVEMNQDSIESMLHILSQNDYENKDFYKELLNKWKSEDFKDIVNDHNELRNLSENKDGFAFKKMSKQQERKFVEEHFE